MRCGLAIALAMLLLFGCTVQELQAGGKNASGETRNQGRGSGAKLPDAGGNAPETGGSASSHVNTAAINLSRNASEVMTADDVPPPQAPYDFSAITSQGGSLIVYYFYSSGCVASRELAPEIVAIEARHPEAEFRKYDIMTAEGYRAYSDFATQHGLNDTMLYVPQVLVNGEVITNRFNINSTLEGIIKNFTPSR